MVLLQVLFCLYALYMLSKYLPQLRWALSRDAVGQKGRLIVLANVLLALGILLSVLLAVVMKGRWVGLISK